MKDAEIDRLTRVRHRPAYRVSRNGAITADPSRMWVSARDGRRALAILEAWVRDRVGKTSKVR